MIPKPPSQCIQLRQNKRLIGSPSISANAVAPVVVKPDIASKKAPAGSNVPVKTKGSAEKRAAITQDSTTVRIPSRFVNSFP